MRTALQTSGITVEKLTDKEIVCEFNEKFGTLEDAFVGIDAEGKEIQRGLEKTIWFNHDAKNVPNILGITNERSDVIVAKMEAAKKLKTVKTTLHEIEKAMEYCNNMQEYLYITYLIAARQGSMIAEAGRVGGDGFLDFLLEMAKKGK